MNSFGEAFFRVDDEIIHVSSVTQTGPSTFVVSIDRGQLQSTIRTHLAGTALTLYTVRPDGLFADQIASTDIYDLRHSVADKFDYESMLETSLIELMKGNLRTTWKKFGSTNSSGSVVFYGDTITDGSVFIGGLTALDGPNGNRRAFSDSIITERYSVPVVVPSNSNSINDDLQINVSPYTMHVSWTVAAPGHGAGTRTNGSAQWWFNGDSITIALSDFLVGLPAADADQARFVLPSEDPDAVLAYFEGMTTDPNGGTPTVPPLATAPTVTNPNVSTSGNRILKNGQGLTVTTDSNGNLVITLNSGTAGTPFQEFTDAVNPFSTITPLLVSGVTLHIAFAVVYGSGRGLSHKPDFVHTVNYVGDSTNSSKVMLRQGLTSSNRMVPTYLGDSPLVQTGINRNLARTSEVMMDPGSKTFYVAPYSNILIPQLLCRDGSKLNWYGNPISYQGAMPTLDQNGVVTVHPVVDPLNLFNHGVSTLYTEISLEYLPKPGLHHVPIIAVTNSVYPSGINFLLMSQEGPFPSGGNTSSWNRNLVSYPSTSGYYIVTPMIGETYGTGSGNSAFGSKYTNTSLRSINGGPFQGIKFPPFYAPARITGVYVRNGSSLTPVQSPFSTDRVFVNASGSDVNLLRDDFDGPTFLLNVDANGDLYFVLNADVLDLTKAASGTTFANSQFIVECTLFGFDRGFLQTNGRLLVVNSAMSVAANTFTTSSDGSVGIIAPAPLYLNSVNNTVTAYYSHVPYQGDAFGTQNSYSDDSYRLGPLTVSEATGIATNPLGPVSTLSLNNKYGYEVLASKNFVTSSGTGRLSGSNPIPLLDPVENPNGVVDYSGTLVDLNRRFSINRVGYEDWASIKFPILNPTSLTRPAIKRCALSEVFDRDIHPEFAGCVTRLPLGIWFRDKDFIGKMLYQTINSSGVGVSQEGTLFFPEYRASNPPVIQGLSTWEGTEFVCGSSSTTSGVGSESIVKVDGTNSYTSVTSFKTTRGGAAYSATDPWPGGVISSGMPRVHPNAAVGAALAGTAYLVRSQPENSGSVEVHQGQELQMIIVTQAQPAYFRDVTVFHSANGTNEGYTAVDRFRVSGHPIEKRRGFVDTSILPNDKPLFAVNITDNPVYYGPSDVSLTTSQQEVIPVTVNGQTVFTLSMTPNAQNAVQMFLNGVKLTYGVDYTVGGVNDTTVTYLTTAITDPPLVTTDIVEFYYPVL
jgi:hypothetical protein